MIVCHCHCITDREIRALARAGVDTTEEIGDRCGAGTGCGGCQVLVSDLIRRERKPCEAAEAGPMSGVAA